MREISLAFDLEEMIAGIAKNLNAIVVMLQQAFRSDKDTNPCSLQYVAYHVTKGDHANTAGSGFYVAWCWRFSGAKHVLVGLRHSILWDQSEGEGNGKGAETH